MPKKNQDWIAVGRRKSSVARVQMLEGKGAFIINNRPIENYFGRDTLKMVLKQPLQLLNIEGKYDINANVNGGGLSGQAGAIRLGIARCLQLINPDSRLSLKQAGMLTRDSRAVERKNTVSQVLVKSFNFQRDKLFLRKVL